MRAGEEDGAAVVCVAVRRRSHPEGHTLHFERLNQRLVTLGPFFFSLRKLGPGIVWAPSDGGIRYHLVRLKGQSGWSSL